MIWRVPRIWPDSQVFILGGGPSFLDVFGVPPEIQDKMKSGQLLPHSAGAYLHELHPRRCVGVNNAYQLGNWIDVLFFGDCGWYLPHRERLAQWPGLKITSCRRFENKSRDESETIKYLKRDKTKLGISRNPSTVCWNNNSGFAAISVAAHLGARQIVLLGFDMTLDEQGFSHWNAGHGSAKRKPPFARHLAGEKQIAADAREMGIEIVNASPISAIRAFKKVKLKEVL